jgi:uncharacterized delta-60 repeat protein
MRKTLMTFLMSMICMLIYAQPGAIDTTFNPGDLGFGSGVGADQFVRTSSIQSDGKIIIGGYFRNYNGTYTGGITRINANGVVDAAFNPGGDGVINDIVQTTAIQSDGKIIIGGSFQSYNYISSNRIARLNSDGTLDSTFNTGSGADCNVQTTAIQSDGKIIIGGCFTSYNGTPRNRIVRLNMNGSIDTTFNIVGTGVDGPFATVMSISIQSNGKIIIGGDFTSYNGTAINRIARLNTDGSLDVTFNPGTGPDDYVYTTAIQNDGKIIIGGDFTSYNGAARNRIMRLNTEGSPDTTFNTGSGANIRVSTTAIQSDGKIVIGGDFTSYNGTSINRIARLNTNGSMDTTFIGNGTNNTVNTAVIQSDGKIITGGSFTTYNGTDINRIARMNTDGSLDLTFNPRTGANDIVSTVVLQQDGKIIIGGDFTSYYGTAINRIARLNTDGSPDTTFNTGSGTDFRVSMTAIQSDGKIIVGGGFTSYNGTAINRIMRVNTDGSIDTTFNPGSGPNSEVRTIAIQNNGKIIIGGGFTVYNGTARNSMARLNPNGTLDATFNPGFGTNSYPYATAIQIDGKIIIGGSLRNNLGATIYISRLNPDGTLDATFNTWVNSSVSTIAIQNDGKIIIGGQFTNCNGTPINRIARLNSDGTLDATFNPGIGANGSVTNAAIQSDGKIIIGGSFTSYNGMARSRLTRLYINGSIDASFNPGIGANNFVGTTSIQSDGKIIIGGGFTGYDGTGRNRLARILGVCLNNSSSTINPVACSSYTSPGGTTYSVSGTYSDIVPNASGCDSIITINLTIRQPSTFTQSFNECPGFSVTVGANTYDTTGVYTDVLTNAAGCDSIVTTDLIIIPNPTVSAYSLCAGAAIPLGQGLNAAAVTASAPIVQTGTTVGAPTYNRVENLGPCMLSTAGTAVNYSTISFTATLTGNHIIQSCGTSPMNWDLFTTIYANSFDPLAPCTNALAFDDDGGTGCSSGNTITINLTAGITYIIVNTSYSNGNSGAYNVTITPPNGPAAINWYTAPAGGSSIGTSTTFNPIGVAGSGLANSNTPGTYIYYAEANGCRQPVNLAINPSPAVTVTGTLSICTGDSTTLTASGGSNYVWSTMDTTTATTVSTAGTYTVTVSGANGCTVSESRTLTVLSPSSFTQSPVICAGGSISVGTSTYSTGGTYTDVLTNAAGCDSTVTTNLTIRQPSTFTQTFNECQGFSVTVGSSTYNTTGVYTNVLTGSNGCDSTVTTNLTIKQPTTFSQTFNECQGFSVTVGSSTYNTTGVYTNVLTGSNGCDSTVTTNLTIRQPSTFTQSFNECQGFSVTVGSSTYNTTGLYTDVLTNAAGCDSTVTTNLTINQPTSSTQTFTECQGFSITVGSNTYDASGSYTDVLTNAAGCDSTVTTNLTINPLPSVTMSPLSPDTLCQGGAAITLSGGSPAGGTYSGTDVNAGSFDPATLGTQTITYSFTDGNGCSNTASTDLTVELCSGISSAANYSITAYPNPTTGILTLNIEGLEIDGLTLSVYDVLGRRIETRSVNNNSETVDLSQQLSGVYMISIEGKELNYVQRIVKL